MTRAWPGSPRLDAERATRWMTRARPAQRGWMLSGPRPECRETWCLRRLQAGWVADDIAAAVLQVPHGIRPPARPAAARDVGAAEVRGVKGSSGDHDPGVAGVGVDRYPLTRARA